MDLPGAKDFGKAKWRSGGRARGRGRGHQGGRGARPPADPTSAQQQQQSRRRGGDQESNPEAQQDRYFEFDGEGGVEGARSQGADLEELLEDAQHYYAQAYYRRLAHEQEDAASALPAESTDADQELVIDVDALAVCLCHLPLSELLGVEEELLGELTQQPGTAAAASGAGGDDDLEALLAMPVPALRAPGPPAAASATAPVAAAVPRPAANDAQSLEAWLDDM
ncbi:hypothetical protein FOA52_001293 [Chlamydomonas sp. UWO 241]|nr:hypothetical protein FOA52_001293 [Chlamydomonas sp. UWO 241]